MLNDLIPVLLDNMAWALDQSTRRGVAVADLESSGGVGDLWIFRRGGN